MCIFGKSIFSCYVLFLLYLSLLIEKLLKVGINSTKITSVFNCHAGLFYRFYVLISPLPAEDDSSSEGSS